MKSRAGLPALAAVLAAFCVLGVGCAGSRTEGGEERAERDALPRWVRIVPSSTDERSFYVGSVSRAEDVESAVETARDEVLSQVVKEARTRFRKLFGETLTETGVKTTSQERLAFGTAGTNDYVARVEGAVRQDSVCYRQCEGSGQAGLAEAARVPGPVCQIFVLMSVDELERERLLAETIIALRKEQLAAGHEHRGGSPTECSGSWTEASSSGRPVGLLGYRASDGPRGPR